jgi:hypothetical protein
MTLPTPHGIDPVASTPMPRVGDTLADRNRAARAGVCSVLNVHRLLEVGDAGAPAVQDNLAELVQHRSRRGVQPPSVQWQADHRAAGLRTRHEHRLDVEVGEWNGEDFGSSDLSGGLLEGSLGKPKETSVLAGPEHHWRDHESGVRGVVVEQPEHRLRWQSYPKLLGELTAGHVRC